MPRLLIGGQDFDEWVAAGSLVHTNALGSEPDTLDFRLIPGAPSPATSAEVEYRLLDGALLFGGVVTGLETSPAAFLAVGQSVRCSDWRVRVDAKLLNERWVGLTAGQIIVTAFARYAPEFDTTEVDLGGAPIPSLTYRRDGRLTDLLNQLASATGFVWDLTPDKRVTWSQPATTPAPAALVDGSLNFQGLSLTPNRDNLRTVVYVRGRPRVASTATVDRFTGDGLTTAFRLTGTPYGTDQYVVLRGDFPRGIDPSVWSQVDATNPSPPSGHLSSDGYLFTTMQQGATLAESGWLQVVGGTGTWGQVRLMSAEAFARGDGARRFEWEVYVETSGKDGLFGLWDPTNQGAQSGARHAFLFEGASGQVKPYDNGSVQSALATITFSAGDTVRLRVAPGAASGAELWVNKDAVNGFRASQWVKLYTSTAGTWASFVIAAVFSRNFEGRVRRIRVFNALYGASLTVAGVPKTLGLLDVDEDAGVDALMGLAADVPQLAFFADTKPSSGQAVVLTYFEAVPLLLKREDPAAVAALASIENPLSLPTGSDGRVEHLIVDDKVDTLRLANLVAEQDLQANANPEVGIRFTTRELGFRAGQVLTVNITAANSGRDVAGQFLLRRVTTRPTGPGLYSVEVEGTTRLKGFDSLLATLLRESKTPPNFADADGPLEEFLGGAGGVVLRGIGNLTPPGLVGAGVISGAGAGVFASGPAPGPYLYASGSFGAALME